MKTNEQIAIDLVNILSFLMGVENLNMNEKQISDLQEHLTKQDEQYEKIIKLLEETRRDKCE